MITAHEAKTAAVEWLLRSEEDLGTPPEIIDDESQEYPWGWVFFWAPADQSKVPPERLEWGFMPIMVNRKTGRAFPVGTVGVTGALFGLGWDREE